MENEKKLDKETVLLILLQLEKKRLKIERKEVLCNLDDTTIRCCQAEIAGHFFNDRNEWTEILKKEYGLVY